jgi:hypothetical protein
MVGLLIGAVRAEDPETENVVFQEGSFIAMTECLTWASAKLGERMEVMHTVH